jgi:hypothetical protein
MIETSMIRPVWIEPVRPDLDNVTVLICSNKKPDLIRLCLESLLTFYPTVKILIVNGTSNDEAANYLRYKESTCLNITVWDRIGYDSHGVAMHEATTEHIESKYVVMLDSDTIIKRAGWIEGMLQQMKGLVFATGTLNIVSKAGYGCSVPINAEDSLNYAHPSCSMFDRDIYMHLISLSLDKYYNGARFTDHGAPCIYTYLASEHCGYKVLSFPIADYVAHCSGASWTDPHCVWPHDNGVVVRPLVTFITEKFIYQTESDYDMIPFGSMVNDNFVVPNGHPPALVNNDIFSQRLRIIGEWVCAIRNEKIVPSDLIRRLRTMIASNSLIIDIDGCKIYRRDYFQNEIAWI